jgi:hypothetical protein
MVRMDNISSVMCFKGKCKTQKNIQLKPDKFKYHKYCINWIKNRLAIEKP